MLLPLVPLHLITRCCFSAPVWNPFNTSCSCSVLLQDCVLFNDTIEYNIRYARPGASWAEVEAAAAGAQILDFINRLPQKVRWCCIVALLSAWLLSLLRFAHRSSDSPVRSSCPCNSGKRRWASAG